MASHVTVDPNQENRSLARGKADIRKPSRPVLGEISQNGRHKPTQAKQIVKPGTSGFTIFSDENAPAAGTHKTSRATRSSSSSGEDKENQGLQGFKNYKVVHEAKVEHVSPRVQPTPLLQPEVEDKADQMDLSMASCVGESPMVLEATQATATQWRVPPIEDNQTVDIFSVPEYSQDIYHYLKHTETKHMPKWNYMGKQPDITFSMRTILVDWLIEVAEEYKLQQETLYLAVSYIDRFLSVMSVQRAKLQLVGAACMFIASKYEEIYPPDVSEFVYITDDTYTKKQVLRMEHLVLKVLGFDLSPPTTHLFVNNYCQMFGMKEQSLHLSMYINELSLLDGENMLQFSPSLLAASSVALARHTLGDDAWTDDMAEQAGYTVDDLKECLLLLHAAYSAVDSSAQQAVKEKYKSKKFSKVADLEVPSIS